MRNFLVAILVFICSISVSQAQVTDTLPTLTPDTTLYYLNLTSTGIINRTESSRSFIMNNNLRFNITRKRIAINTVNSWIYGNQQTGLTNNDFTSAVDVSFLKSIQKFYYWGLAVYDKSYSLKITDRIQAGGGVGFKLFNSPSFNIHLSDGILFEYVDLYDTTGYQTYRNSFRIKYHIVIKKMISLEGTNFLQNSFLSGEDYIIRLNNTAAFKIKNWLSLTVATTYNKLNINRKENFLCNIGLSFQKTFTQVK